jgi:hypothetical protein
VVGIAEEVVTIFVIEMLHHFLSVDLQIFIKTISISGTHIIAN